MTPKRKTATKITHGFDPRKVASTVSFTCSACGQHCGENDGECPYCHAEFVDHEWNPPADIKGALEKQKPMQVKNIEYDHHEYCRVGDCRRCGGVVYDDGYAEYCPACGQRLRWD